MQYLKIENSGVAPVEGFTVLGASTTNTAGVSGTIGRFGSGNKHSVNICLRNNVPPIIFCGNRKLEFFTRKQVINDGLIKKEFARVCVKNSGKDNNKTYNSTDDLGFVLDYGASDWTSIDLALREFVSNAIDRSFREYHQQQWLLWCKRNKIETQEQADERMDDWKQYIAEKNETATPWQQVIVEIVEENQVRAQKDKTRVFIPINDDVYKFKQNLGRWFLHFSEQSLLKESVLPKRDRNLSDKRTAVIYKQGVRVREVKYPDTPSLFDYNLNNLELDESRTVDDYIVKSEAAQAIAGANKEILAKLINSMNGSESLWEHSFDAYSLSPQWNDTPEVVKEREKTWTEAFHAIAGDNAVLTTTAASILVTNKGYKPIAAPENFVTAAAKYGLKTAEKVLTQDDLEGRVFIEATPAMKAAVDYIWALLEEEGLTLGKQKPEVKGFRETMTSGVIAHGKYSNNVVYLNEAFSPLGGYASNYPKDFLQTVLEELSHHCSAALDSSRDFQDYAFKVAITFMLRTI